MSDELLSALEMKVRQLDAVNVIGKTLTSSLELSNVLDTVMRRLAELLAPRQYSLLLVDEKQGDLVFEVAVGEGAERLSGLRLPLGEGIAGWAAQSQESVLVTDVASDPRFAARFDEVTRVQTRSLVAVPLVARGRTLGVIELVNGLQDRAFTEDDLRFVSMIGEFAAIGIDNAANYRRVEELTILDDHTALYNSRYLRRVLTTEIERSRRFSHSVSVVFFDLDHFKQVNDTHGHAAGTALLAEVAGLVSGSLRAVDVPTRYGGDEFVLVLPQTPKQAAVDVAVRLRDALGRQEFLKDRGLGVCVTGSFGVAAYPEDGGTPDELLKAADQAMYLVKGMRRDGIAAAGMGLVTK